MTLPPSMPSPPPLPDLLTQPSRGDGLRHVPARPPRVWTVFAVFALAFVVASVGAGLVAVAIAVALHGPNVLNPEAGGGAGLEAVMREPAVFLPMLLATQVILGGAALGAAALSPVPLRRRLRLGRARLPWYGYGVVALGTLAVGHASGVLIELLGFGDQGVLKEFERAMTGLRGPVLVLAALVVGLSPGFGEEFLFRGYTQTRLRQRWPRWVALVVTALMFGFIHLDLVQGTFAVLLGLWLGEVADRTGSVWPAVVGHAVNNGVATVMSALIESDANGGPGSAAGAAGSLAVSVPVFVLCLAYLLRRPVVPAGAEAPGSRIDPAAAAGAAPGG